MRTWRARIALAALLAIASVCSDTVSPGGMVTLTAQQSAAIRDQMEAISALEGELGWLSDSAGLVIKAGAEVERIVVTVDGQNATYYGVGLHREYPGTPTSFATFHLLAFDNPNAPRNFVVANGYAQGTAPTPPSSVAGSFGGTSVFAHLIQVQSGLVTSWPATSGTASFASVVNDSPCFLPQSVFIDCRRSSLEAEFSIADVGPPTQPLMSSRSASLAHVSVPGVTIRIQFVSP